MKNYACFLLLLASISVLFVLNLLLGTVHIPVGYILRTLAGDDSVSEVWRNIVWQSRLPQALSRLGYLGDAAMSVAAIVGALAVMLLIVWVSQKVKGNVTLLIIGVMIGYLANAIIGVLKFLSPEEDVKAFVVWGLGSFSRVSGDQMVLFVALMAVLLPLSMLLVKPMNLMLLGDRYATNLGLNIRRARLLVIVCSGVLVAIVTAYCGPIMFIGLAVPHLARGLFRTSDHRTLMPATALSGAALALVCNLIARMPGFEGALPVNSVTALVGAPVIAMVLFCRRKDDAGE